MTDPQYQRDKFRRLTFAGVTVMIVVVIGYLVWYKYNPPERPVTVSVPKEVEKEKIDPILKLHIVSCARIPKKIHLGEVSISRSSDYSKINGYIDNIGKVAVNRVGIESIWKDETGVIVEANNSLALVNDVLEPGKQAPFNSVTRNSRAKKCSAKIIDWWVVKDAEVLREDN